MNGKNLRICMCLLLIIVATFVPMFSQRALAANSSVTWDTDVDFDPGTFVNTVRVGSGAPAVIELDSTLDWVETGYDLIFTGRTMTAMAFDPTDDIAVAGVAVMFGGLSSERFLTDDVDLWPYSMSDTWEFDPSTNMWIFTDAGSVPFRYGHAMVYDSNADRILMFGGYGDSGAGSDYLNDLWEYDASMDVWNQLISHGMPGSPEPRKNPSLVYDSTNNVVILFGGRGADYPALPFNDTWEYDYGMNTWTEICDPCTPSARTLAPMSFDSANNVAILFGGTDGRWYDGPTYGDLQYEYDASTNTWSALTPAFYPSAVHGGTMVFDSILGESVLHGGYNTGSNMAEDEVWSYNRGIDQWNFQTNTFAFRAFHAMVYDSANSQSIIYGGASGALFWFSSTYGDVYTYDSALNNWNDVYPLTNVPPPTYSSSMTFDEVSGKSVLYSGYSYKGWTNRVWSYDAGADTWTLQPPSPSFPLPTPRFAHTMVYSEITGESIMMGGVDANIVAPINFASDVWGYNLSANTWDSKNSGPPARANPGMAYSTSTDTIVLFGGVLCDYNFDPCTEEFYSDTWIYDPITDAWSDVSGLDIPPAGRYGHYMTYDKLNHLVIMYGGINSAGTILGDTWTFDPVTYQWDQVTPASAPSARAQGRMIFHEGIGCSLAYGGVTASVFLDETWCYFYDATGGTWIEIITSKQPDFGVDMMLSYDSVNNIAVCFGGQVTSSLLLDWGGTYELTTAYLASGVYTTPTFDAGAPVANWGNLTWTGNEPMNTDIRFQIATNMDSSTWNFVGPDGTSATYYDGASGVPIPINNANHADDRYLRVMVFFSTTNSNFSPKLDVLTLTFNQYPNAPALTAPTAGSIVFSTTPTFTWAFSGPDPGDTQAAFQLLVGDMSPMGPPYICDTGVEISSSESWLLDPVDCGGFLLQDDTTYYWIVRTQDQDGAWSTYAPEEMFIVNLDPTRLLIGSPNYTAMGVTYFTSTTPFQFTATGAASTLYRVWDATGWSPLNIYTAPFTISGPDGIRYIEFYSIDLFGNSEAMQNYSAISGLYLDNTPPTTTIGIGVPQYFSGGITYVSSATTFTMTPSDGAGSGVGSSWYKIWDAVSGWSAPTSGLSFSLTGPDGPRHIEYNSTDNVGNTETPTNLTNIYLDNTPPTTTLAIGTPNTTVGGITFFTSATPFTLSTDDGIGSGVAPGTTLYRIWDAAGGWSIPTTYMGPFTITGPDGYRYIEYSSADNVQNVETTKNYSTISELYLDNALPVTSISWSQPNYTSGGNTYITSSTDITIIANKPAASIFYKLGLAGALTLYTSSFTIGTEGSHTIYYNATDALGNVEAPPNELDVIVDNGAPTTAITVIGLNATINSILNVGETTEFRLTAVDNPTVLNCGVGKIWYKIDQTGVLTEYTGEFNLSGQTDGSHTIYFYSEDNLGNTEAQQSLLVFLDLTNPVANAGADISVNQGDNVTFDGSQSSDNSGSIYNYSWTFVYDGQTITLYGVNPIYQFSEVGNYEVTLEVEDFIGHSATDEMCINATSVEPPTDLDNDGLPDEWEQEHFGNLEQDATGDPDKDGFTNIQEWQNGTNPAVSDKETPDEFPWWIIVVIIALIIVVIIVALMMPKTPVAPPAKEAPAEEPPGESPAEPPAEPPPG